MLLVGIATLVMVVPPLFVHFVLYTSFAVPVPPVPPLVVSSNVIVYVFAVQVAVNVALPLVTPKFVLLHAMLVEALWFVLFTFHLLNVYPVTPVIAAAVVKLLPYVQDAGVVGAVPLPPLAQVKLIVLPLQFGLVLDAVAAVPSNVPVAVVPLDPT